MALPNYQQIMLPLMHAAADGAVHRLADLIQKLAVELKLTPEDRAEVVAPGRRRVFDHRVWWARTDLVQAGLLKTTTRGTVHITERGARTLTREPAEY